MPIIKILPHAGTLPRRQDLSGTLRHQPLRSAAGKRHPDRTCLRHELRLYHLPRHRAGGLCNSLNELDETEEDLLDRAWGLEPNSRLSCQAIIGRQDLVVEIPRYTINHARENH
jgi:2Fe-2S ferredoxin